MELRTRRLHWDAWASYLGAPMKETEDSRIVESTEEARAAVTGHNVRYVLLIGTAAVIAIFAAIYIYSFA